MQLTHVLIGKSETIDAKSGKSGINKRPQPGPIEIDLYGLKNDAIVDTQNHGGLTQAVYIFGQKDYDFWGEELGQKLQAGTFGENLIISDLSTHDVNQDDIFTIGDVTLKVTFPRIPCVTLAARMNNPDFPNRFPKQGHVGVYCTVTSPGFLSPNTKVIHTRNGTKPILDLLPGYRA